MSGKGYTNGRAVLVLALIHIFGLNSMYGLIYRNGYSKAVRNLFDKGPYVLPGSNEPILTRFTGIDPLDKLLRLAAVMFANVTDGSTPQLSLYAFQFAGQLVSVLTVVMIEGGRRGNRGDIMSWSMIWGCTMNMFGYGFIMPIYGIVHLLSSSTATKFGPLLVTNLRPRDLTALEKLPLSIFLGYVVPTVLMCLPFPSPVLHQWLGGFWQGFPVWVTLLQYTFGWLHRRADNTSSESGFVPSITVSSDISESVLAPSFTVPSATSGNGLSPVLRTFRPRLGCGFPMSRRSSAASDSGLSPMYRVSSATSDCGQSISSGACKSGERICERRALHRAYLFAFGVNATTHFITGTIITARHLFPPLFSQVGLESLTFREVFLPQPFYSWAKMKNMATGIHSFFQYDQYVGSAAAVAWAAALHSQSQKTNMTPNHWIWLVGEILVVSLVAGPGGALVSLMWHRDNCIIGDDGCEEKYS